MAGRTVCVPVTQCATGDELLPDSAGPSDRNRNTARDLILRSEVRLKPDPTAESARYRSLEPCTAHAARERTARAALRTAHIAPCTAPDIGHAAPRTFTYTPPITASAVMTGSPAERPE